MIYEYRCDLCEVRWTESRPVAEMDDDSSCPKCLKPGTRCINTPPLIFKTDGFPSNDLKGSAFYREDGRNMSFSEYEFLEKEAADDEAAAPETCLKIAEQGRTGELIASMNEE